MTVNISTKLFDRQAFVEDVRHALAGPLTSTAAHDLLMRKMTDSVQGIRIEGDVAVPTLVDAVGV